VTEVEIRWGLSFVASEMSLGNSVTYAEASVATRPPLSRQKLDFPLASTCPEDQGSSKRARALQNFFPSLGFRFTSESEFALGVL
jgi:hypothetical protein